MRPPALNDRRARSLVSVAAAAALWLMARSAGAQATPAAASTPPDDTPSIRLGTTLFADYTYQQSPTVTDADGNTVHPSAFNVSRAYLTVMGNISHVIGFRVTGDVSRETATGSSLNGSLMFRLKYGFMSVALDDWLWKGSWVRLGIQQTPYVEFMENVYRYRFQGTIFTEREGYLVSSDAGVSFHTAFPRDYGEVHLGYYNGDGYNKADPNNEKAFQIRGTVRPLPMHAWLHGLRVTGFYDHDDYIKDGPRTRALFNATFEHRYVNAGFDYLATTDRQSITLAAVNGRGWSFWVTPRSKIGIEGLFRYDSMKHDTSATFENQINQRTIAGIAYWFPKQGGVSSALLLDYEQYTYANYLSPQPTQRRWAVHGLVQF